MRNQVRPFALRFEALVDASRIAKPVRVRASISNERVRGANTQQPQHACARVHMASDTQLGQTYITHEDLDVMRVPDLHVRLRRRMLEIRLVESDTIGRPVANDQHVAVARRFIEEILVLEIVYGPSIHSEACSHH